MTPKGNQSVNKLAKGSYFLILDNFANLGIGAIFWLVLSKLMDPTVIGQAMVITGLAVTIIGFSGYGIQLALSKYLPEFIIKNMPNSARKIVRGGIKSSLMISAVIVVAVALLAGTISKYAYNDESLTIWMIFIIATFVPTQTVTATLIGAFQGMHKMSYVAITDFVFQISRLGFALAAVVLGYGPVGILMSFAVGSFLSLGVAYLYFLPRALPKRVEGSEESEVLSDSKTIAKFTGLNYFSIGMKNMASQLGVLILGTQSFEWAAFYGLAYLIAKVVGSFSHSVGSALLPTAAEERTKGNKEELQRIANIAVRVSILISGFGFILLMIDPTYFLTLISNEYVEAGDALRILTVSALINSIAWIMTSLLNASNRAFDVAKIGLVSAVITIALTFGLVRIAGTFEGAAVGWLAGSVFSLIISLYLLKSKEDLKVSWNSIIRPFVAILSGLLVGFVFVFYGHTLIGIIASVLCFVGFSLLYKVTSRREIRGMIGVAITKRKRGQ